MSDQPILLPEPVLPKPAIKGKRNHPGHLTHKPGCICRPCVSRRRQEEAIASGAGPLPPSRRELARRRENAINADLGTIEAPSPNGLRSRIVQYVELRTLHPDLKNKEIAQRMGIAANTLESYLNRAVKQGILKFDDPIKRLEHEIAPRVLDNLKDYLEQKDKQVTIEAAKGILFPLFKNDKGIQEDGAKNILAIKFEFPAALENAPQGALAKVQPPQGGTVVGKPKIIDAEIVEK